MTATATRPIADLLTRTRAKADQRHAADSEAYGRLVTAAAEGNGDPDQILKHLDRTGRDVEAFQADVEFLAERMLLKATLDGMAALTQERDKVEASIRNLDQEHLAAVVAEETRFENALQPLRVKHHSLSMQMTAAEQAEQKLRATCPPERLEELAAASRAVGEQRAGIERIERGLAEIKARSLPESQRRHANAIAALAGLGVPKWPGDMAAADTWKKERDFEATRTADLEAAVARIEREELPAAREELARLEREQDAAAAALLLP